MLERVRNWTRPGNGSGARAGARPLGPGLLASTIDRAKIRRRRVFVYLAAAGPGLVAASAGNDAGGVVTYASAGSEFEYRTLFLIVLITIAYVVVQEMVARLSVFTGKGLAALIREEFPLRLTAFAVGAFAIANLGLVVTELAGIGTAFQLFGVSRYISVPLAAIAIWALVLFGTYRYAERVLILMTLLFVTYPIAAILGHPDWSKVVSDSVLPHFIASRSFVFLAVALIGTTITPYIQLYEAGAVVDKGIGPDEFKYERADAIGGAILSDLVSIAIIVATAAAIGGSGVLSSASQAANALRPIAHSGAVVLFGVGLLGASALAAAVVPLSTSYAVAEAVGAERSITNSFRRAPLFLGLFTAQILIGVAVVLVPVNLLHLIVSTQALEGLVTPVILMFILVLANRRSVLGAAANGPLAKWLGGISVVAVGSVAAVYVALSVLGWFGIH